MRHTKQDHPWRSLELHIGEPSLSLSWMLSAHRGWNPVWSHPNHCGCATFWLCELRQFTSFRKIYWVAALCQALGQVLGTKYGMRGEPALVKFNALRGGGIQTSYFTSLATPAFFTLSLKVLLLFVVWYHLCTSLTFQALQLKVSFSPIIPNSTCWVMASICLSILGCSSELKLQSQLLAPTGCLRTI